MLKKSIVSIVALSATVAVASQVSDEFFRRDSIALSPEQSLALQFLSQNNFPVKQIDNLEITDATAGTFIVSENGGQVCMGNYTSETMRCKNAAGILTLSVSGEGDGD